MNAELSALVFGLFSALSWGAGDFNGGLAARRAHVIGVVAVSHGFGLLLLLLLALVFAEPLPPVTDLLIGAVAGLAGMVGLAALYGALAAGKMGIAAPVSGVLTAALPVLFSLMTRGLPDTLQILGFLLAFAGVALVSYTGSAARDGIGLALLAGLGFGVFFILLDQIVSPAIFWPLVAARVASLVITGSILLAQRRPLPTGRSILPLILLSSTLDVAGNVFFLAATQSGRLDIAAVVSSLYPAATILLAWFFLRERLSRLQTLGVVFALLAIGLIAL